MNVPIFTDQQRQAMQWLGYQRWIVREELVAYQSIDTNATKQAIVSPYLHMSQPMPDAQTMEQSLDIGGTLNTVNPNASAEECQATLASAHLDTNVSTQGQASCLQPLVIEGVNLVCSDKITLMHWHAPTRAKPLLIAMPPLWGSESNGRLFASEHECSLFVNALHACGLGHIATNIRVIEHYLSQRALTLSKHDDNAVVQVIPPQALIVVINATLPLMKAFQESLSPALQTNVVSMIHPYCCLEQPRMKAVLWQQLIDLQDRLNDD